MKVVGVIAEYNPFHNGHKYQLDTLREQTGADYLVVAMSGSFLQRGVPAITDKYTRAQMALEGGADLVLELPSLWSTASAEYFAKAGVYLLGSTGVVSVLGYGVEEDQPHILQELSSLLQDAPRSYHAAINRHTRNGLSFPAARAAALSELLPDHPAKEITRFLSQPNNILALEYEKALIDFNRTASVPVKGCPITRIGDGYHNAEVHSHYASATALRRLLKDDPDSLTSNDLMPAHAAALLLENYQNGFYLQPDDFSQALYAKLLAEAPYGYEKYADCTPDLSRKILKLLPEFVGFEQFCLCLKSKDLTYTRISRVLLHILLGITKEQYRDAADLGYTPYLRALGFRKDAAPLLSGIKQHAAVPFITKPADAISQLDPTYHFLFRLDSYSYDLYRGIQSIKKGQALPNEFARPFLIV